MTPSADQTPLAERVLRIVVLAAVVFLVWPVAYDFVLDWWVRSTVYPYGAVFIVVALIFGFLGRKGRPASQLDGRGLPLLLLACCGLIAGRWAAEFVTSRGSVWLMVVSLIWVYGGLAMVRYFSGPLVLDLTSIPPPQIVFNVLSAPFVKITGAWVVWFSGLAGITMLEDGNALYTVNFQMALPDAVSSIRNFPGFCVIGYLFAQRYRSGESLLHVRHWKTWLYIIAVAAAVSSALVLLRVSLAVYLADHNEWHIWARDVYRHMAGIWASIAGVLVIWLSQALYWRSAGLKEKQAA